MINDRFNGFEGSPRNCGLSFSCDSYPLVPERVREGEREEVRKGRRGRVGGREGGREEVRKEMLKDG